MNLREHFPREVARCGDIALRQGSAKLLASEWAVNESELIPTRDRVLMNYQSLENALRLTQVRRTLKIMNNYLAKDEK